MPFFLCFPIEVSKTFDISIMLR